jgi:hypothetical protein
MPRRGRARAGLALLAVWAMGCAGPTPTLTPSAGATVSPDIVRPTAAEPVHSPSLAAHSHQPGQSTEVNLGPLAVFEMRNVPLMDGLIRGRLAITSQCAFIEVDGDRELVVWPYSPDSWRWDPAATEIVSLRLGEERRERRFGSGDPVTLGGGDVPPEAQAQLMSTMDWLAAPRDACMTPTVFVSNGELTEFEP